MFEISVETSFHAVHAVTIDGVEEIPHDHDWKVIAKVEGDTLNSDGILLDFIGLQRHLEEIVSILDGTNLNDCEALDGRNPTTELVAWYIASHLCKKIPTSTKLSSIQVTEAPHCIAIYRP